MRAETALPIRWLVLTHMHPDHVFGAAVFAEAGATVVGHARLPAALANRAESYRAGLARGAGAAVALASEVVLPDESVAARRELDLGGRRLLLDVQPTAHTDNDLTVLDVATGTWFLGDLLFVEHLPAIDGSVLGWLDLLGGLKGRAAARAVPGLGPAAVNWPAAAAPMRSYLAALVAEPGRRSRPVRAWARRRSTWGQGLRGEWRLFDDFSARNATAAYRELEWE